VSRCNKGVGNRAPMNASVESGNSEGLSSVSRTALRPEPIRFLRLARVLDLTGLGKTKIYGLQAQGTFPMRIQITRHSVGWIEEEVKAWLAQRVATSSAVRSDGVSRWRANQG
jgi:prophage regulatory protein